MITKYKIPAEYNLDKMYEDAPPALAGLKKWPGIQAMKNTNMTSAASSCRIPSSRRFDRYPYPVENLYKSHTISDLPVCPIRGGSLVTGEFFLS